MTFSGVPGQGRTSVASLQSMPSLLSRYMIPLPTITAVQWLGTGEVYKVIAIKSPRKTPGIGNHIMK